MDETAFLAASAGSHTQFVTGPTNTTLPMLVYSSVRRGVSPEINVLASVIVGIVTPLEHWHYDTFVARFREGQIARNRRIDLARRDRGEALDAADPLAACRDRFVLRQRVHVLSTHPADSGRVS